MQLKINAAVISKLTTLKISKMKTLKKTLIVIFVLTFITACSKDENDPIEILEKTTISAKWNVGNSSEYKSFEFNESGNYIIVKNNNSKAKSANNQLNQIVLFGTYEINDKTIILSDFGTLIVSEVNEMLISFSIQLASNSDSEIIINASKQEEMDSTVKTVMLCRTWEMASINGKSVIGTEYGLSVLFSNAGTYFVERANLEDENDGGLANWKWSDNTETKFLYSWDTPPVWSEEDIVEVIELTDNLLKVLEIIDGEEELYELVPISNNKSARIKLDKNLNRKIKIGFLKK